MAALLADSATVLLLGCGGGSLATMLHRATSRVTIVEVNPVSFELARTFFWMPNGIECIAADMRAFVRKQTRTFDAIGIDVGGPDFSYEDVLDRGTIAGVRRALRHGGRIAVNISCEAPDDPVPSRIAERFKVQGLDAWMFMENAAGSVELNAVILASARKEAPAVLAEIGGKTWSLGRLTA